MPGLFRRFTLQRIQMRERGESNFALTRDTRIPISKSFAVRLNLVLRYLTFNVPRFNCSRFVGDVKSRHDTSNYFK